MASKLRVVSWVLLALAGALVLLGSVVSANLAYSDRDYPIAGVDLSEIAAGRDGVATGLRGVRGTSAAYAAGFAVLFLFVVLGPYRRGERWAWWALLAGVLAVCLVVVARASLLGTGLGGPGVGTALTLAGVVVFALLLDVTRLTARG